MEVTLTVTLMSPDEARQCVSQIQAGMENVRTLLLDLYEREGWKALEYDSWRHCIAVEFSISVSRAYQLLDAAHVDRALSTMVENAAPIPERQARELARLKDEPEAVREVWAEAQEEHGEKVTAADVREAVDRRLGVPKPAPSHQRPAPRYEPDPDVGGGVCFDCRQSIPVGVDACPSCAALPPAHSEAATDIRVKLADHDRQVIARAAWHAALTPAGYTQLDPAAVIASQTPLHVRQGIPSLELALDYLTRLLEAAKRVTAEPARLEVMR